jgi:WD40 repeat protein
MIAFRAAEWHHGYGAISRPIFGRQAMSTRCTRSLVALLVLLGCCIPGRTQPPVLARLGEPRARQDGKIENLMFSPEGRALAAFESKGVIRLWDVADRKERVSLRDAKESFLCMAFSPDGKAIAVATEHAIHLYDTRTGREVRALPHNVGLVSSMAVSHDGHFLAVAGQHPKPPFLDAPIHLLDLRRGEEGRKFSVPRDVDPILTFLPDSRTLAVWGMLWRFWDVSTGEDRTRYFTGAADGPKHLRHFNPFFRDPNRHLYRLPGIFSPNGRILVAFPSGRGTRLFDMMTRGERSAIDFGGIARARFSADSRVLLTNNGVGGLFLWDIDTGRQLPPLLDFGGLVDAEALGPDGATLATAMQDGTIELRDIRSAEWRRVRRSGLKAWEFERCWRELLSSDGWAADQAAWLLAADAPQSLPFLKEHLRRVSSEEEIHQLIRDLDSEVFQTRERAMKRLQADGDAAESALRHVMMEKPSLELRRRVKDLLEDIEAHRRPAPVGERLRAVRAVRVLEHMETKEAREILEDMARGGIGARETQEAQEAVQRLKLRSP